MKGIRRQRMMWAIALLLPLMVFAGLWAHTHHMAQQGRDWLIPVKGYDPRDLLRGHYIQYQYDWAVEQQADDAAGNVDFALVEALCIEGAAPNIDRVSPLEASPKRPCAAIARATLGARREVRGLVTGILYTSQERARQIESRLADPRFQALLRVRIRPDGVMRPIDMAFRPRPTGMVLSTKP